MKSISTLIGPGALSLGFVAVACGDDETGSGGSDTTTTSTTGTGTTSSGQTTTTGTGGMAPNVPSLGPQIDRMGRPGINTVTTRTFLKIDMGNLATVTDAERAAAEDTYNEAEDPAEWNSTFNAEAQLSLAVLDSLDANCSNQLGACMDPSMPPANGCYATLATILLNDYLIVNGASTDGCVQYLGAEAEALLMIPGGCGGRTPAYDVIETSYSVLAAGTFVGVDDEIAAPPSALNEQFPYLTAPN